MRGGATTSQQTGQQASWQLVLLMLPSFVGAASCMHAFPLMFCAQCLLQPRGRAGIARHLKEQAVQLFTAGAHAPWRASEGKWVPKSNAQRCFAHGKLWTCAVEEAEGKAGAKPQNPFAARMRGGQRPKGQQPAEKCSLAATTVRPFKLSIMAIRPAAYEILQSHAEVACTRMWCVASRPGGRRPVTAAQV